MNNYIDASATAHAETHTELLAEKITDALALENGTLLKEALEEAAEKEKQIPGFLKRILEFGKGAAGKLLRKSLKEWLSDPAKTVGWPSWVVKAILSALE